MNIFDAVVLGFTLLAIGFGFHAGLLRSLATILGYVVAAPFAVAVTPPLAFYFVGRAELSNGRGALVLFGVFLVSGMLFSALLRRAVSEMAGGENPDGNLNLFADVMKDLTAAKFLRACVDENDRYMRAFDSRLLRPRVIPTLGRIALAITEAVERLQAVLRRGEARA